MGFLRVLDDARSDSADRYAETCPRHADHVGNLLLCVAKLAQPFSGDRFGVREPNARQSPPASLGLVLTVLSMGACVDVLRVNTRRAVATVSDNQTGRDIASEQLEGQPMGVVQPAV